MCNDYFTRANQAGDKCSKQTDFLDHFSHNFINIVVHDEKGDFSIKHSAR
jgi:hypothetical protein